jgi:hypothetical protein
LTLTALFYQLQALSYLNEMELAVLLMVLLLVDPSAFFFHHLLLPLPPHYLLPLPLCPSSLSFFFVFLLAFPFPFLFLYLFVFLLPLLPFFGINIPYSIFLLPNNKAGF